MPKFNSTIDAASSSAKTPGHWRCVIHPVVTQGDGKTRHGVETTDTRTGKPRRSTKGAEQWGLLFVVDDDHPDAPSGAWVFDSLTFDGMKAEARAYALLKAMGHPVDAWKRASNPPDITPELLHGRPVVIALVVKENETTGKLNLEPDGYMPFSRADAWRGPTGRKPSSGSGGAGAAREGNSGGGGATHATGATVGGGAPVNEDAEPPF